MDTHVFMTELEEQALRKYTTAEGLTDGTSINQQIRSGETPKEVVSLDNMMQNGGTPSTLYRVLENENVCTKDNIIHDCAYVSTSAEAEYAMSLHFMTSNTALFIIKHCELIPSINVKKYFGDANYEAEFILPRNLKFKVCKTNTYNKNWQQLKNDYSLEDLNEREWSDINSITVYEIIPLIYRPEWTCGRYNSEKRVALFYNLISGFSYFFESYSADVIGRILSSGRNGEVDIKQIALQTGIAEESIQDFAKILMQNGLLTNHLFSKEEITRYRAKLAEFKRKETAWVDKPTEEKLPMWTSNAEQLYFDAVDDKHTICSCMFEMTYRCSEMCIHCYNPGATRNNEEVSHRADIKELTLDDYKRIVDEMYELGLVKVCLSGGDPFSKEITWELIDYLYQKEIAFDIFTNGQRITKDVQRLANYYPRLVGVSIYSGVAEDHDAITRIPGSWERSMQVVKQLSDLAIPMNLKCCVMQPNLHTYYMVADLAKQYGAQPQFEINITESNDGDLCAKQLRLTEEQLQVVLRDNNLALYIGKEAPNYGAQIRDINLCSCGAGGTGFCMAPNGDLRGCPTFTLVFGNTKEQSVLEILANSKPLKEWRKAVVKDYTECGKYDYCDYCNLCAGVNYTEHGDFRKPAETNCYMAKCRYNLAHKLMEQDEPMNKEEFVKALQKLPKAKVTLQRKYDTKG